MDDLRLIEALEEQDRRRAQESFLAFYMRMTRFEPPKHAKVICKFLQAMDDDKIDRGMLFAPPRHIKRLADDTPMLTVDRGWTTHGKLRVGDRIWHPSGHPVTVEAVAPPGASDLLVTFSNGETIQCDGGHLWTVWDRGASSTLRYQIKTGKRPVGSKTWETLTTDEIISRGVVLSGKAGARGCRYRWHLPDCLGIVGVKIDRDIGPYSLGAWLGDGSSRGARLTCGKHDIDAVVAGFEADGYVESARYIHADTGVPSVVFSVGKGCGASPLRKHLEAEGVWGNKHIPEHWLTASREQRLALLAGLMDTDGHCEADTGRCRIVTTIEALATGIHGLCASLGYRPYITSQEPDGKSRGGITTRSTVFTVGFQPTEPIPCRIERKRAQRLAVRRALTIRSIERVAPKSCRCIKVSAPDGLYLAGRSLIPTHNTTLASDLFPAWLLGRHPKTAIMGVAHTDRYAKKIGAKVRNRTRQPEWPWPDVDLAEDSQAKNEFRTNMGGEYNGFGMFGGNQHGNPAEWLFMDDIVKGRKLALSSHMREEAWETYRTDLLSRLQGRRKQLITITRWNMDDPPGRILPEGFDGKSGWYRDRETGEPWYVLSLPAIAEHDNDPVGRKRGEWLWPEAFGEAQLGGMRKRGGWVWSALYQQRPAPEDGMLFMAEHFQRFDPRGIDRNAMRFYISSDYATKDQGERPDPDWTVHLVFGVDSDLNIYLVDGWRGRSFSDRWVREWLRLVKKWKPMMAAEEAGQINAVVGPFLKTMMRQEQVFVARHQFVSSVDKVSRAQGLLGMAAMGKLFLPDRSRCERHMLDLLDAFETEMLQFPTGRHDDTVDAATLFARMLDKVVAGEKPRPPRSLQGDTLEDLWSQREAEQDS